jgi:hypothetical protein
LKRLYEIARVDPAIGALGAFSEDPVVDFVQAEGFVYHLFPAGRRIELLSGRRVGHGDASAALVFHVHIDKAPGQRMVVNNGPHAKRVLDVGGQHQAANLRHTIGADVCETFRFQPFPVLGPLPMETVRPCRDQVDA